jgi:hypothetical protein
MRFYFLIQKYFVMEIPGEFVSSLKMMVPGGRRGYYGEEN